MRFLSKRGYRQLVGLSSVDAGWDDEFFPREALIDQHFMQMNNVGTR